MITMDECLGRRMERDAGWRMGAGLDVCSRLMHDGESLMAGKRQAISHA